jgi:hypothetical protein
MTDMVIIIDRFEEDIAVCEKSDRSLFSLPRSVLPPEAREGDVVIIENQIPRINHVATAARKKVAEEKLKQITKQNS